MKLIYGFLSVVLCFFAVVFINSQTKKMPIESYDVPFTEETAQTQVDELELSMGLNQRQAVKIKDDLSIKVDTPINDLTQEYSYVLQDCRQTKHKLNDLNYKIYELNSSLYPQINEILKKKQQEQFLEMKDFGFMDAKISAEGKIEEYINKPKTEKELPMGL